MEDNILCPESVTIDQFLNSELSSPFDELTLEFIDELRALLVELTDDYSEFKALGFWLRKQKINNLKNVIGSYTNDAYIRPKGTIFQIAAGNTLAQFMYPSLLALLLGNRLVVKLSSKTSLFRDTLLQVLNQLLRQTKYQKVAHRFLLIDSEHDSKLIKFFSERCDLRATWGGDKTIEKIRQIPVNPTAKDISFADRTSIALINSEVICRSDDLLTMSSALIKDVLTFGQQACSSPRMIAWLGSTQSISMAKEKLFDKMSSKRLDTKSLSNSVEREIAVQLIASKNDIDIKHYDNLSTLELKGRGRSLTKELFSGHAGHGVLINANFENLETFIESLSIHFQTLAYIGFQREELINLLGDSGLDFFDRIEPIGTSLDFHYIWDAYNLLHEFCRCIRK